MLSEKDCPKEKRLLPLLCLVPGYNLPTQESIDRLVKGNQKVDRKLIKDYLNWSQADNEIIVYTGYGYCDLEIPKTYNYLLNLERPDKSSQVQATVKFAIWNGRVPIDTLLHGHKTICIISFKNEVPTELKNLPDLDEYTSNKYIEPNFGLCNESDIEFIIKK